VEGKDEIAPALNNTARGPFIVAGNKP